jgi:hypothetical protein
MSFKDRFYPLRPLVKIPSELRIMAFDTEDNGTGAPKNFICGCVYEGPAPEDQHIFWDRDLMRKHLFRQHIRSTVSVAHNLQYDLNNIDHPEKTCERLLGRTRLIGATFRYGDKKQMRILDTSNFFVGASIESLGTQLGFKKLGCKCDKPTFDDFGICHKCQMFCVHYLRNKNKWKIPTEARRNIEEYCMRDSEICYRTMQKLMEMTHSHRTRFKCFTAPSLAIRIFRTNHMPDAWMKRPMDINDTERLAYYGGRTEVFDYRFFEYVYAEDIRSSYPRAMHDEIYPFPPNQHIVNFPFNEAIKFEGVSLVRVRVPPMHIPPLPYRREDGKLLFPTGEWTAAYTHPEIKMAMRHGVEILECHQSIIYPDTFRPFTTYVKDFYQLKDTTKGIDQQFYKLLLNSNSGKWGEKRYQTIHGSIDDVNALNQLCGCHTVGIAPLPYPGTNLCSFCNKPIVPYSEIEIRDSEFTLTGCRQPDPKNAFPILIAYITAYGRIKLFEDRLMQGNNGHSIVYTDTDSAMSDHMFNHAVGPDLGNWERQTYEQFLAYAPKYYDFGYKIYEDKEGNLKKERGVLKLKGVPKKHEVIYQCPMCFGDFAETPEDVWKTNGGFCCNCYMKLDDDDRRYKFERPLKAAEAERRHMNPNTWVTVKKFIRRIDDKRIKHSDGTSSPLSVTGPEYKTFEQALKRLPVKKAD